MKILVPVFSSLFLLLSLYAHSEPLICRIYLQGPKGLVPLAVEIANNDELRRKGLMFRNKLGNNRGMIFVFPDSELRSFWMKNTYIPLDIAFISASGTIINILPMKPLDTVPRYNSTRPAMYALEVNQGWFQKNNIRVGDRVLLNGCIGQ